MNNTISKSIKNTFQKSYDFIYHIILELLILGIVLFTIVNNLNRFTNVKTKYLPFLSQKHLVFLYGGLSVCLIVFLIYCKNIVINNKVDKYSTFIPILFILVPAITGLIYLYLDTNQYMEKNNIGKSNETIDKENKLIIDKNKEDTIPFGSLPMYITSKNMRVIIQVVLLIIIIYNFLILLDLLNQNDSKTILDRMLTSQVNNRPTRNIIITIFQLLIILNIIMSITQYQFQSCKFNLPRSWNF